MVKCLVLLNVERNIHGAASLNERDNVQREIAFLISYLLTLA